MIYIICQNPGLTDLHTVINSLYLYGFLWEILGRVRAAQPLTDPFSSGNPPCPVGQCGSVFRSNLPTSSFTGVAKQWGMFLELVGNNTA